MTGIDRTSLYIEEARRRAAESGLEAEFVVADVRNFVRPEAFDLAINLFSSFGYFEDEEDHRRVIRNAHASLRPGGRLIVDIVGREPIAHALSAGRRDPLPRRNGHYRRAANRKRLAAFREHLDADF